MDDQKSVDYNRFYIFTDLMLESASYNGGLFPKRLQDWTEPNGFDAPSNVDNYMLLYVDKNISVNEFIIMLKQRFFAKNDNVQLEDIWLYRVCQNKFNYSLPMHRNQVVQKYVYGTEQYECPLFSKYYNYNADDFLKNEELNK